MEYDSECREGLECRDQVEDLLDGFMSFGAHSGFGICVASPRGPYESCRSDSECQAGLICAIDYDLVTIPG